MLIKRSNYVPAYVNFFDDFFGRNFMDEFLTKEARITLPTANIVENESNFQVELAVPGYDKKDFSIEVNEHVLSIKGEVKSEKEESKSNRQFTRKEHYYASFERNFTLPDSVKTDAIEALYENGLLTITLPKKDHKELQSSKLIQVK
ncbi:MAG: Hsp20/alpha crystallin family protein [Bacteroidales bacterium]|mgnify:FL=1|jgi:HSP20 family protein|nr:Hsp20/alpha crystallin family protein [Bacteroidales bacterium]MDD3331242.1 Hsp20/alpha crystallin family protein [Bacteroidales bacterium]MDD3691225.1 Hsp20/alpha crystallin family protein [Bacteroidales bacterium]MDD4045428.1 Hsp20/alpha crystallin family protein [Bacteroidales bacterium]MDD4582453.1 Hsp20/alpha crystallin family protein [Bacteroidales bacterium]